MRVCSLREKICNVRIFDKIRYWNERIFDKIHYCNVRIFNKIHYCNEGIFDKIHYFVACLLLSSSFGYGQVVQLPAVGSFGVSTTMSVPDRGTGSLGGSGRMSSGTATRGSGPLRSSARGAQAGATSVSVTATIIDLAAMDEAITNMPASDKNVANFAAPRHGTKIVNTLNSDHFDRDIKQRVAPPLPYDWMRALGPAGTAQADSAEAKVHDASSVRYFLERAAEASSHGRAAAAKVYFEMALNRMTPAQRKRFDEIRASRGAEATSSAKKDKSATKTPEASEPAATTAEPPADASASPFDM